LAVFKGLAQEAELVRLLADLISIESVNPSLKGGQRGEAALAEYVTEYMARLGLEVRSQPVLPGRANVLGRLEGKGPGLILEAHMDTVTLEPMPEALAPRIRDGRVYGRGACDTKGSLAAMLYALKLLREHAAGEHARVLMAATVDEEVAFRGVLALVDSRPGAGAAVVGEPTELVPVIAHKGVVRWRILTHGRAAHTSKPEEGNNAIYQMVEVIRILRDRIEPRLAERAHPFAGAPSLCVSVIHGGLQINIVPPECAIEIDRRTVPGETHEQVLAEIDETLDELRRREPSFAIEREAPMVADWPLFTPPDSAIALAAVDACRAIRGHVEPAAAPYGTDASKLSVLGHIPSLVLGPGSITQAHTDDEWVSVAQVIQAAEIYAQIAVDSRVVGGM
jgi:acetylornithine deacetylase/succinyl-diaminopimelate desuccinylase-like protein